MLLHSSRKGRAVRSSAFNSSADEATKSARPFDQLFVAQSRRRDGCRRNDAAHHVVLSSSNIITLRNRPLVANAALSRRLPAIGLTPNFARDGLPITFGPTQKDIYRSAATLVARILDGATPAGLPIERPVHYALVINLQSAKALGLTIPQSLLLRADEVIQ